MRNKAKESVSIDKESLSKFLDSATNQEAGKVLKALVSHTWGEDEYAGTEAHKIALSILSKDDANHKVI